jgi:hypothetical protein
MQMNFLDQLKKEKRSLESGFTTDFQVAKDLNKEALAGGLSVAESVASTNPALALSMVQGATGAFSTGINKSLATISTRSTGYTQSIGELINTISQRKLDVETYKTAQQLGLTTDALQKSNVNAAQFAARLPQYAGDFGKVGSQINSIFSRGGTQPGGASGPPITSNFADIMNNLAAEQVAPALNI